MDNLATKLSLLVISLFTSNMAYSQFMDISFFKKGNPALDKEVITQQIEGYYISDDKTKILRHDNQFEVTTSYEVDDSKGGAIVPYKGTEEVTYKDTLSFPSSDIRYGASNLTYWAGKAVDTILDLGFLKTNKLNTKILSHCQNNLGAWYEAKRNIICVGHYHDKLGRDSLDGMASLAWDADVVIHELAHGIYNHLNTMGEKKYWSAYNDLLGAMNEGQADFIAHVITGTEMLAPWMIKIKKEYYQKHEPRFYFQVADKQELRKISNNYRMDNYFKAEIHQDGSILAGALHKIAEKIGKNESLKIWLESIPRIQEENNYYDIGKIMEQVDQEQNFGQNQDSIIEAFEKHSIYGNPELLEGDIELETTIIDDHKKMMKIVRAIGVNWYTEYVREKTLNNNGNGQLEKGECGSLEFAFKNVSDKNLIGLEVLIPIHLFPPGIKNEDQNRAYMGFINSNDKYPQTINLQDPSRPWIIICTTEDYKKNLKIPIFLRNSGKNTIKLEAVVN